MQVAPTTPFPSPVEQPAKPSDPPLGTWVDRSDLAGARAEFRDRRGAGLYMGTNLPAFADAVVATFDWNGDGRIAANESARTQQYTYASNRDGSRLPASFVYPNTTIRQETVSVQPLIDAVGGADGALSREEFTAFLTKLDTNGNGYLDGPNHPGPENEYANFLRVASPIVVEARQMTVEGKLMDVGGSVWDFWPTQTGSLPVPPVTDTPVLD